MLERQFLELAISLVEAEPVRDRRVDVERFAGDAHALVRDHRFHRAHVVQAVCQLDQDHAHVARHRQQHLAERFGLRFLAGRELQLVELGQSIDQFGRRCPEALDQFGLGDAAVFHRVVHQRGHDRLSVEFPFGAQAGHGDRVRDVGLAADPVLAEMRLVGEAIGVAHPANVGRIQVLELDRQRIERRRSGIGGHGGCGRSPPRSLEAQSLLNGFDGRDAHPPNLSLIDRL